MAFAAASSTGALTCGMAGRSDVPAGADVAGVAFGERQADPENDKRRNANDDDQNFHRRILPRLVGP